MPFSFVKMQTLGNDFVLLDQRQMTYPLPLSTRRWLADRHRGVGCDQLLVIEPAQHRDTTCHYKIFNPDGSEAQQCGNGVRCIARYLFDHDDITGNQLTLTCQAGMIKVTRDSNGQFSVDMGVANFIPTAIGLDVPTEQSHYTVTIFDNQINFGAVSMGNPHAVMLVDQVNPTELDRIGAALNEVSHPLFSQGVNISQMRILDPQHIELVVYERGVGRTLGCGSGACAAVVLGQRWGKLAEQVQVTLPGGQLQVSCDGMNQSILMCGDAHYIFNGSVIKLPNEEVTGNQ